MREQKSGSRVMGTLVGASVALPAAAGVFVIAGLSGVPVGTAVTRSVVTGVFIWVALGLAVRVLFSFVIRNWQKPAQQALKRAGAAGGSAAPEAEEPDA